MRPNSEYIAEISREVRMRHQVYPGLVKAKKMTQAAADRKTELMRQIGIIFEMAELEQIPPDQLTLPIHQNDLLITRFPITTLEPHIHEAEQQINWRSNRILKQNLGAATKEAAIHELSLMHEMLEVLRAIQGVYIQSQTQLSLFK